MPSLQSDRERNNRHKRSPLVYQGEAGSRLEQPIRCLHHVFEKTVDVQPHAPALLCGQEFHTYAALEERANQLAHHLRRLGAGPGSCVGLLLERSLHTYVALLATLKCGATFVPLDTSFPADRLAFIAEDAGLCLLVTTSFFQGAAANLSCPVLFLDSATSIAQEPATRLQWAPGDDSLCYIIYTSGTTGRPKGVGVTQASIGNFLTACMPIYGISGTDRVYQGMTLAFDFSIEEIWPTFAAGALLVAGPVDHRRLGAGLTDFLIEQRITVLCCVPTLLATIERDVPTLRVLLVGGEACPADLVQRWSRSGRRMLNTYGPTETTVTATWTELVPDKPVTIGRPMPTYAVYILDEQLRPVPPGTSGEICIGGPGVAVGYIKRPELTAERFVPDPFDDRAGARLYRTGDLGRLTFHDDIEYLGRIDSQVKIRGYRIELGEIEAILLEDHQVASAIVTLVSGEGNVQELVAHLTVAVPIDPRSLRSRLHESLRRRLPAYMVPAFIEILDRLPMLASGKADRARLPTPVSTRLATETGADFVPPSTAIEKEIAGAWRRVFGLPEISIEADFFLDLGGHSLFAAMMISDLRMNPVRHGLAMADLYAHPTIRGLAQHVESHPTHISAPGPVQRLCHGTVRVWACGFAQCALLYLMLLVLGAPVVFLMAGERAANYGKWTLTSFLAIGVMTAMRLAVPILGKWLLVGRVRPGRYPLWGWFYCRWWLCGKLLALAPLGTLAGSPFLAAYLRLLGARIGKGCHLGSGRLQTPDLLEIGSGTSIGYGADLEPFLVEDGWLYLAPIRIGAGTFVGANAVIMLGARVGDGACVGEQSLVARDQAIPPEETWTGSPSRQTTPDTQLREMVRLQAPTRWPLALTVSFVAGFLLLEMLPWICLAPGLILLYTATADHAWRAVAVLPAGGLLFVLTTCLVVAAGKRLVLPRSQTGLVSARSWFGIRKWFTDKLMALSLGATNSLYATLYTSPWLRLLGAKIGRRAEISTVSNIDPDLLVLGSESFIADLAVVGAARYHGGTIALGTTQLGDRCFVGNAALIPTGSQLPSGSLIGVQSVPPSGPMKQGSSWLGAPAIFLPRRQLSEQFDETVTYRPSARLVAYRLAIEFARVVLPATFMYALLLGGLLTLRWLGDVGHGVLAIIWPGLYFGLALAATGLVAALKWLVVGRYRARVEPMWSFFVWRTELITALYENVAVPRLLGWFTGTPLLAPLLRLFGARIGPRVYLATTFLTEFDLVHVGADAMIGRATSLQTHLFEDRVMKMSTVTIGPGCAVGPRSVVLYDAALAPGAHLDALSLAMKAEMLPGATRWRGIPAQLIE